MHYDRMRRRGTTTNPIRNSPICSIDDCTRLFYGRGWCQLHWSRWRRHGDPMYQRKKRTDKEIATDIQAHIDQGMNAHGACRAVGVYGAWAYNHSDLIVARWGVPRCDPTENDLQALDGHLLGDGCLKILGQRAGGFSIVSRFQQYINWVNQTMLPEFWLVTRPHISNANDDSMQTSFCWVNETRKLPFLREQFLRWYHPRSAATPTGQGIKNEKRPPRDLALTPIVVLRWYMDDGSLNQRGNFISLSTHSFRQEDVEFLAHLLRQQGIKAQAEATTQYERTLNGRYYPRAIRHIVTIRGRENTRTFLDYIGPCPVKCFAYKWDWRPRLVNPVIATKQMIHEYVNLQWSLDRIAKKHFGARCNTGGERRISRALRTAGVSIRSNHSDRQIGRPTKGGLCPNGHCYPTKKRRPTLTGRRRCKKCFLENRTRCSQRRRERRANDAEYRDRERERSRQAYLKRRTAKHV